MSAFETDFAFAFEVGPESYFGEAGTIRYIDGGATVSVTIVSDVQVGVEDASGDAFFVVRSALVSTLPQMGDEFSYQSVTWQITKANRRGDGTIELRLKSPEERV